MSGKGLNSKQPSVCTYLLVVLAAFVHPIIMVRKTLDTEFENHNM